ncbi:MAG: hypothetical protein ACQCN3_06640 [Candidatus Bathyarchaeia archaeon]
MHKKALLIIATCLVIVLAASLFTWYTLCSKTNLKQIDRNFNSQKEETALTTAESINYSQITTLNRFHSSSNPDTYSDYEYANYIDSEVLTYYDTRYFVKQGQIGSNSPKGITFTYQANASECSQFQIYNSPAPEGATWHNITIVKCTPSGLTTYNSGSMQFFYRNQSTYQLTQWDYNFNYTDCYVVEMNLHYSEYYAPVAAFSSNVHQIVILDQNLTPILVGVESQAAIA